MRRSYWVTLLASAIFLTMAAVGQSHGGALAVYITLDPPAPTPGAAARIQVEMKDAYGNPLPAVAVRAAVSPSGQSDVSLVALAEGPAGMRSAQLPVPPAGLAMLRLEADMPDGLWLGEMSMQVGPGAIPIKDFGLELVHQEQAQAEGTNWLLTAAAVVMPSLALLVAGYLALSVKKGTR